MENEADLGIDYKGIGKRIKAARRKKGLNQKSLAMLADIAPTNLSHIERGATKVSLPTLVKIANSLGVSIGRADVRQPYELQTHFARRDRGYYRQMQSKGGAYNSGNG